MSTMAQAQDPPTNVEHKRAQPTASKPVAETSAAANRTGRTLAHGCGTRAPVVRASAFERAAPTARDGRNASGGAVAAARDGRRRRIVRARLHLRTQMHMRGAVDRRMCATDISLIRLCGGVTWTRHVMKRNVCLDDAGAEAPPSPKRSQPPRRARRRDRPGDLGMHARARARPSSSRTRTP